MDNGGLLPVCAKKLQSLFPTKLHALLSNPIHFSSSFAASIYRIDLELLKRIQTLVKVSMLQRKIWALGVLEACLVSNNLEMLLMLV
jgi:hypothetical protein